MHCRVGQDLGKKMPKSAKTLSSEVFSSIPVFDQFSTAGRRGSAALPGIGENATPNSGTPHSTAGMLSRRGSAAPTGTQEPPMSSGWRSALSHPRLSAGPSTPQAAHQDSPASVCASPRVNFNLPRISTGSSSALAKGADAASTIMPPQTVFSQPRHGAGPAPAGDKDPTMPEDGGQQPTQTPQQKGGLSGLVRWAAARVVIWWLHNQWHVRALDFWLGVFLSYFSTACPLSCAYQSLLARRAHRVLRA